MELPLPALSQEAAEQLIESLAPSGVVPGGVRTEILSRAEGNPLYIEELLQVLMGAGAERKRKERRWTLASGPAVILPPALEGILAARIDRLSPGARQLAQVAAVIGRDFPVRVLAMAVERDDIADDLAVLLRAEIVREVRRDPELECRFRHGLLHEAALSTLPPGALRVVYRRVGDAFERLYVNSLDQHLDALAFYYYRSDRPEKALHYLERAGARAGSLGPTGLAEELLTRAGKVAASLGDTDAEQRVASHLAALGPT
jgi:predicted ATPase